MASSRTPAVAGLFYPAQRERLAETVDRLLAEKVSPPGPAPKALIVPHAGYVYSGATAASAYARLRPVRERIRRVVLLGPSHYVPFRGLAAPSVDAFATPLGEIPLDREALAELSDLPQVSVRDDAHRQEHSLEVQLPFLQVLFKDFRLFPLVVGEADQQSVAEVLERLWGGPETVVLISSDLSHFHDYATARALDQVTTTHIEALQPEHIGFGAACGRNPINGLLDYARRHGHHIETLALCSSGDTAGDKSRVVGYGAYALR